jgi:thymidylate kinase
MQPPEIHRIVLTGGPCAGKSTALLHVADWLTASGLQVYRVPEASTMLLGGGARVVGATPEQLLSFQRGILQLTLALEDSFLTIARASGRKSVLVCDRGAMDGSAYIPPESWKRLLEEACLEEMHLLEQRYDAVIHLVTAAIGAEDRYGAHNNLVRYESVEEARGVDERLRQAWQGHPRLRVIDNSGDFKSKLHRVVCSVCEVVGLPPPGEQER